MEIVYSFVDAIESCYQDEFPLPYHCLSEKNQTVLHVISEGEFHNLSISTVQSLLRSKHLLLVDCTFPTVLFDNSGLQSTKPLTTVISIDGNDLCL
jgi:hypothetical protein